ncbi:MAG TPA: hypothetical protein VNS12_13280 [Pelagibacterium sp.]|uniref:hypothetical protein n=1 Tax=Pelagibacterium sp. TaxID=1967288 RepID=UPI002D141B44|nr:hypothetical protein [Pelagibacterium sp.]HWJ89035.1 hypothetical protein [Pelagibacterium sp.]
MSKPDRDQRLAAKLKENLRRRKAQAKARATPQPTPAERETGEGDTKEDPQSRA